MCVTCCLSRVRPRVALDRLACLALVAALVRHAPLVSLQAAWAIRFAAPIAAAAAHVAARECVPALAGGLVHVADGRNVADRSCVSEQEQQKEGTTHSPETY